MPHVHTLQKKIHTHFLQQNRKDPITGESIQENDKVVICAGCKCAFLLDSWNYMHQTHCNQEDTLAEIPVQVSLVILKKQEEEIIPFRFTDLDKPSTDIDDEPQNYFLLKMFLVIISGWISIYPLLYTENIVVGGIVIIVSYFVLLFALEWITGKKF